MHGEKVEREKCTNDRKINEHSRNAYCASEECNFQLTRIFLVHLNGPLYSASTLPRNESCFVVLCMKYS